MKTIENVTLYKCDYCNKELKRKHAMIKHEKTCERSPDVEKACFNCKHLDSIEKEVWFDNPYYNPDYSNSREGDYKKVNVFHCKKLDKLMFPYSIEKRDLHNRFPSTYEEQEAMPHKCFYFEKEKNMIDLIFGI